MRKSAEAHLLVTAGFLIFIITAVAYWYFTRTPYFTAFQAWSSQNLILYVTILFFLRTIGLVFPPLVGAIFVMAAIPVLGWPAAYALDFASSLTGSCLDYYLGRKYGLRLLSRLFDQPTIAKISATKIRPGREIETIFVMRILMAATLQEAVFYGAGFLKVKFRYFLVGTSLSHLASNIPIFYFASNIFSSQNTLITVVSIIVSTFLVYKLKNRYLE